MALVLCGARLDRATTENYMYDDLILRVVLNWWKERNLLSRLCSHSYYLVLVSSEASNPIAKQ